MNMQLNFGLTKLPIETGNDGCIPGRYVRTWWIVPSLIIGMTFLFGLAWLVSLVVD